MTTPVIGNYDKAAAAAESEATATQQHSPGPSRPQPPPAAPGQGLLASPVARSDQQWVSNYTPAPSSPHEGNAVQEGTSFPTCRNETKLLGGSRHRAGETKLPSSSSLGMSW